jgi:hypothetical protein
MVADTFAGTFAYVLMPLSGLDQGVFDPAFG